MIERDIIQELVGWKEKAGRKPLMLFGARQVGKTSILKYFGEHNFDNVAYVSFDEDITLGEIFNRTKDPKRILETLSNATGTDIRPQTTLIILDEIQECPAAIASLKYFCENAPEYAVACAGSMLGLTIGHAGFSFPVGKVDHIDLFPLSFSEFLRAKDKNLHNYLQSIGSLEPIPQLFFDRLAEVFTTYRICGGMPEAASAMLNGDTQETDTVLNSILKDYSLDFVKHASPLLASRVGHVWNSLPSQLARENRKFVYQLVRPGARAREYEDALIWLRNAGLIHMVNLCREPRLPLKAYDDLSIFKVYSFDIGILRRLAEMDASIYYSPADTMQEFKGALAENYILQSLVNVFHQSFRYWSSGNKAEVEFLLPYKDWIFPIEVKAGTSITGKSLTQYQKNFSPKLRLRYSMRNLTLYGNLLNIPLFMADRTKDLLQLMPMD